MQVLFTMALVDCPTRVNMSSNQLQIAQSRRPHEIGLAWTQRRRDSQQLRMILEHLNLHTLNECDGSVEVHGADCSREAGRHGDGVGTGMLYRGQER